MISMNTAKYGGNYMGKRFSDLLGKNAPKETRTSEEIIESIKNKINGGGEPDA